jgi:hypothetical protein
MICSACTKDKHPQLFPPRQRNLPAHRKRQCMECCGKRRKRYVVMPTHDRKAGRKAWQGSSGKLYVPTNFLQEKRY